MKKNIALGLALLALASGCATGAPDVKSQQYAALPGSRTFEYDFPTTWKAIESAFSHYKVIDRDPKDVNTVEMKRLTRRTLETDWVFAQSRDKYQEFKINGSPSKIYLQTKVKYLITARTVLGGVDVSVQTKEEIERLKKDGTSDGFEKAASDPSRASDMIDKIGQALLSAAP